MIRFAAAALLLLGLFLGLTIPCAAVSTVATACVASWTDLGAGPMTIEVSSPNCVVAIADLTPGASQVGFHMNQSTPFVYTGSSHLWARGTGSVVTGK